MLATLVTTDKCTLVLNIVGTQSKIRFPNLSLPYKGKLTKTTLFNIQSEILQKEKISYLVIQKVPNIATCALHKNPLLCLVTKLVLTYNLRFSESFRISENSPLVSSNPPSPLTDNGGVTTFFFVCMTCSALNLTNWCVWSQLCSSGSADYKTISYCEFIIV